MYDPLLSDRRHPSDPADPPPHQPPSCAVAFAVGLVSVAWGVGLGLLVAGPRAQALAASAPPVGSAVPVLVPAPTTLPLDAGGRPAGPPAPPYAPRPPPGHRPPTADPGSAAPARPPRAAALPLQSMTASAEGPGRVWVLGALGLGVLGLARVLAAVRRRLPPQMPLPAWLDTPAVALAAGGGPLPLSLPLLTLSSWPTSDEVEGV